MQTQAVFVLQPGTQYGFALEEIWVPLALAIAKAKQAGDELSPHLAVQYDYYVEAKRILLHALARADEGEVILPQGVPTLEVGREVLLLAEVLTKELKELVPHA